VELAQAGLWKDAGELITGVTEEAARYPEADVWTIQWDEILIRRHAEQLQVATQSIYPLINHVFYGDYAAAVDTMRDYSPEEIFSLESPAMGEAGAYGDMISSQVISASESALVVQPDLAPAYFLRAWAYYLANPEDPRVLADVQRAAELAPEDKLYSQCLDYLRQ